MQDLQERFGLAYLFISHDLAVVDLVCDELIVLQHGRVVERGPTDAVLNAPQQPYTRRLLDAVPRPAWGRGVVAASAR
jgi:ABC-type microcin C transport system duplicated ATPase subunit YejF